MRTPLALLAAAACTLSVAACAVESSGSRDGPAASLTPLDPVERSQLRERALTLLARSGYDGPAEERVNALEALIGFPRRLEPLARRALLDSSPAVRAVAATTVGKARLTGLTPLVQPLAYDNSVLVRSAALYALWRCGEHVDIEPLAPMLRDPSPSVRAQAAFLLGEMNERSALPMLHEAARDPMLLADQAQWAVLRLQLAEAMIKLGDAGAINVVRAALFPSRPEDLEATALAVQIIGEVNDEDSAFQLKRLALSAGPPQGIMPAELRLACAAVLARIGRPRGDGSFLADEYWQSAAAPLRAQAAVVYGATGKAANLPFLARMLDDPDGRVRVAVASAILKITDPPGVAAAR